MNCFECAKVNDSVAAVGICRHCGVGLCLDHVIEAHEHRIGGTIWGCPHQLPTVRTLDSVLTGIVAARRHHTATAK